MIPELDLAMHVARVASGATAPTVIVAPDSVSGLNRAISGARTEPIVLALPVDDEPGSWTGLDWIADALPDDLAVSSWTVVDRWSDERLLLGLVVLEGGDHDDLSTRTASFTGLADELLATLQHHHGTEISEIRRDVEMIRLELDRLRVEARVSRPVMRRLAGDGGEPHQERAPLANLEAIADERPGIQRRTVQRLAAAAVSQSSVESPRDAPDADPVIVDPFVDVGRPRPTRLVRLLARLLGEPPALG